MLTMLSSFLSAYSRNCDKSFLSIKIVSLSFFWMQLERQVHINGKAQKVSSQNSDEYFASRPHESQIGAWASLQSEKVVNRAAIDDRFTTLKKQFENKTVMRPPHWGGFLVEPYSIEFWQGRENRLHDRILF